MRSYDAICIFRPELSEEKRDAIVTKIEGKIKSMGGEVTKTEKWGMKKLSFSRKKSNAVNDGFYVAIFFKGEGEVPNEISSILKVTEGVFRYIITVSNGEALDAFAPPKAEEKVDIAPSMIDAPKG